MARFAMRAGLTLSALVCILSMAAPAHEAWHGDVPIENAFSAAAPTLATYRDELHLIYRSRITADLYHSTKSLSGDWSNFERIVTDKGSPIETMEQPTAVSYDGRLHLIYLDVSTAALRAASFSGGVWRDEGAISIGGKPLETDVAPAAAVHNGRLHVVYRSPRTSEIHVAWMYDDTWYGGIPIRILDGDAPLIDSAPALAAFGGQLYTVYKAFDGLRLHWAWHDGTGWHGDVAFLYETRSCNDYAETVRGATLVAEGDSYLWLFAGDAERTALSHLKFDGNVWHGEDEVLDLRTITRPGAALFAGRLHIAYKGWGTNRLYWAWK